MTSLLLNSRTSLLLILSVTPLPPQVAVVLVECPYQWSEWVGVDGPKSVEVWPPEPFGPAGVELWHRLAELLACVAVDPADREPPPWAPLLAVEAASLRWVERGTEAVDDQVWSLTQFYSVDFSQSRIGVKKCVFNKRTIKVSISCC